MNVLEFINFLEEVVKRDRFIKYYKIIVVASSWLDEGKDSLVWNCRIDHDKKVVELYCCEYKKEE